MILLKPGDVLSVYDIIKCTSMIERKQQLFMSPHGTRLKLSIAHAQFIPCICIFMKWS